MFILKRVMRADGTLMGDIIPLEQLCSHADLVPRFGPKADVRLTKKPALPMAMNFGSTNTSIKKITLH